jgi:hypothetical protein
VTQPLKADTPLLVDPDAVLASVLAFQRLEPVARWDRELPQSLNQPLMNANQRESQIVSDIAFDAWM